jgi:hypothetical protein
MRANMAIESVSIRESIEITALLYHIVLCVGFHRAAGEIFVEVGRVSVGVDDGNEGSLYGSSAESVPVDLLEPRVVLYFLNVVCTNAVFRVFLQQSHQEILKFGGNIGWHLQRLIQDGLEELHSVLASVGRETGNHLVDDAAEAPPINGLIVALLPDDLGS